MTERSLASLDSDYPLSVAAWLVAAFALLSGPVGFALTFPAERPVAVVNVHVREALLRERLGRRCRELLDALDRIDLLRDAAEDRRGVSGSGPDLERPFVPPKAERLGHQRDDVRLRDGLPAGDRQRPVVVGDRGEVLRQERLALDAAHRGEHPRVGDPARAQVSLDHRAACRLGRHGCSSGCTTSVICCVAGTVGIVM